MKLSEIIQKKHDIDYSNEIANLIFFENHLDDKLKRNRLLKSDREMLSEALAIIRLGEY